MELYPTVSFLVRGFQLKWLNALSHMYDTLSSELLHEAMRISNDSYTELRINAINDMKVILDLFLSRFDSFSG